MMFPRASTRNGRRAAKSDDDQTGEAAGARDERGDRSEREEPGAARESDESGESGERRNGKDKRHNQRPSRQQTGEPLSRTHRHMRYADESVLEIGFPR
jgi:hypothetical protein